MIRFFKIAFLLLIAGGSLACLAQGPSSVGGGPLSSTAAETASPDTSSDNRPHDLLGSNVEPSDLVNCDLDPTNEKCIKRDNAHAEPAKLSCVEGLTAVRLVYWKPEDAVSNPLGSATGEDELPEIVAQTSFDDFDVSKARYADFCLALTDGSAPFEDWAAARLGFPSAFGVYFPTPKTAETTFDQRNFADADELKASLQSGVEGGGLRFYTTKAPLRLPGK